MGDLANSIYIICIIGKAYAIRFFVAISLPRQQVYHIYLKKSNALSRIALVLLNSFICNDICSLATKFYVLLLVVIGTVTLLAIFVIIGVYRSTFSSGVSIVTTKE